MSGARAAFRLCGVPVEVEVGDAESDTIVVRRASGPSDRTVGREMDRATSAAIFARSGDVAAVTVRMAVARA